MKERSVAEIQQECANLLFKAGQLQYQIEVQNQDLKLVVEEIKKLNVEGAAAQKREAEAAKASEGSVA